MSYAAEFDFECADECGAKAHVNVDAVNTRQVLVAINAAYDDAAVDIVLSSEDAMTLADAITAAIKDGNR